MLSMAQQTFWVHKQTIMAVQYRCENYVSGGYLDLLFENIEDIGLEIDEQLQDAFDVSVEQVKVNIYSWPINVLVQLI